MNVQYDSGGEVQRVSRIKSERRTTNEIGSFTRKLQKEHCELTFRRKILNVFFIAKVMN